MYVHILPQPDGCVSSTSTPGDKELPDPRSGHSVQITFYIYYSDSSIHGPSRMDERFELQDVSELPFCFIQWQEATWSPPLYYPSAEVMNSCFLIPPSTAAHIVRVPTEYICNTKEEKVTTSTRRSEAPSTHENQPFWSHELFRVPQFSPSFYDGCFKLCPRLYAVRPV